jgi:hypothetical protein
MSIPHFLFKSRLGFCLLVGIWTLHLGLTAVLLLGAIETQQPLLAWLYGALGAWGVWSVLVLVWRMLRGPYAATGLVGSPRLYLGLAGLALLWGSPWLAVLACVIALACYRYALRFTGLPSD